MKEPRPRTRAARNRPPLPPVPGGKALARLAQFDLERGLDGTEAVPTLAGVAPAAPQEARRNAAEARAAYLEAFNLLEDRTRMAPALPVAQGWRPLGPFCIPHGQTYGSGPGSRPAVAGRISAVAVDPGDADHILIGAAGGGVWETRDGGDTWQPRTDNQPSLAMGAIAFDPSNPSMVYAGTGEGDAIFRLGAGLLRSTDGGTTWAVHAAAPFVGSGFYDLVVDPLDGNHLLAGTRSGPFSVSPTGITAPGALYESTDGGATWTQRRNVRTWDFSMHPPVMGDPNSTDEVFAGCEDGLFHSTNGGTTWSAVALPGAPTSYDRIEVCHAPSDGNIVYVFAAGPPIIPVPVPGFPPGTTMPTPYLWRREVFGGAFTAITPPGDLLTLQAWYDWFAAVAPNNPDILYLGAIDGHKGTRSAAGTWTWEAITARNVGDSIHPDQHHITFSPTDPNVVFIGNDGGIYRSPNGGANWETLNKGLCITEFEYLAQHPQFEAWLLAGTQDNGTQRFEGEDLWFHVADGDGGDCGANHASSYTCYHTYYGMGMERSTTGGGWGSWSWIGPFPPVGHRALFYPPLEVQDNVVVQAGSSVFISTDTGTTWNSVNLPGTNVVATALAIASSTRAYAGTNNGNVYRIEFSGGSWQPPVALTRPRVGFVSDLLVDASNPNRLWATYSSLTGGHVYRSDDAGTTWNNVSAGLPDIPANTVCIDPANPDTVWVAMDVGVYQSTDAGGTWAAFSNHLPNALVKDLVFHAPSRLLRAATQSRGVWEIAVDGATMPDVEVYLRDSVVDTGRQSPSPSGVSNPFISGAITHWYECTDIKVDAPSYQTPLPTDVDFEVFEDDHGVFAVGLQHENAQRNRTVRVFVQVHNRGVNAATNVAVKVFFADASLGLPDLPAGFWTGFPANVLPGTSPWQPIAAHQVIPSIEGGRAEIIAFDWPVPATANDHSCLLAILSADNDEIATSELNIANLVLNNKKCGLKNLTVVDPPPAIGPRVRSLYLKMWGVGKEKRKFSLATDRGTRAILRGIVLSKRLSRLAQEAELEKVELTPADKAALERLTKENPALKDTLDVSTAYRAPRNLWLREFELDPEKPEPLVLLLTPRPPAGSWSLLQRNEQSQVVGGYTLQALGSR
jgi:photosystem II stability/assembly factor-like uncharacterized protein